MMLAPHTSAIYNMTIYVGFGIHFVYASSVLIYISLLCVSSLYLRL